MLHKGFLCTLTEHERPGLRPEESLHWPHTRKSVFAGMLRTYEAVFDSLEHIVLHSIPTIHAEH